jgi:hypothetical protein
MKVVYVSIKHKGVTAENERMAVGNRNRRESSGSHVPENTPGGNIGAKGHKARVIMPKVVKKMKDLIAIATNTYGCAVMVL